MWRELIRGWRVLEMSGGEDMRYSIRFSNAGYLTHEFFAVVYTNTGWTVCLAGRQGCGTHYCTPVSLRFRTKRLAKEWRDSYLAKKPYDYWIAEEGKYLLNERGELTPCLRTKKKQEVVSSLVRVLTRPGRINPKD